MDSNYTKLNLNIYSLKLQVNKLIVLLQSSRSSMQLLVKKKMYSDSHKLVQRSNLAYLLSDQL